MYYLQSRYYNPELGRFINADSYTSTGQGILGNNMFAYCGNNPVTYRDSSGTYPEYACDSPAAEVGRQIGEWIGNWLAKIFETYPTKEEHYNRNASNPEFPNQYDANYFDGWDDKVSANCHQFTSPERSNKKYVSPDGKFEAIYDANGYLVDDPRDEGTYNFISPNEDGVGHFIVDVVPWIRHGNSPYDTTGPLERCLSFVGIYLN